MREASEKEEEAQCSSLAIASIVVSVIMVVVAIVLAAITFGAAGALIVAAAVLAGAIVGAAIAAAQSPDSKGSLGRFIAALGVTAMGIARILVREPDEPNDDEDD